MAKGYLDGIDVSSNQPEDICRKVAYDFAIVKMGGNPHRDSNGRFLRWNYMNENVTKQAGDALAYSGCLGLYWFCYGKDDPTVEAKEFVRQVKLIQRLRQAILVIDYEADALKKGREWLKKFAKCVEKEAGYPPVIYASGSVIKEQQLSSLGYQIWCANYYLGDKKINGYNTTGMKLYCPEAKIWQYTENGYLKGYGSKLDLDRFYGTKIEWAKMAGIDVKTYEEPKQTTIEGDKYKITASSLNVRNKRSTITGKVVGELKKGSIVYLKNLKKNNAGNTWGQIVSGTYKGKYIAVIFKKNVYAKKG